MTRRQWLAQSAALSALSSLPLRAQGKKPPNVLLLMSDQHKRSCLGAAGDRVARTPNLDGLARQSVRFDSMYCSNPVCTPSRASLLTGLYTHNHQSWNNTMPLPPQHKTMAHYFGGAGYLTSLIGKMHFVDAQTHGFDYHLDFNDWFQFLGPKTKLYADELSRANSGSGQPQIDALWHDEGDPWKGVRQLDDRQGPVAVGGISSMAERDHFESFVARESVRFLHRFAASDQPFFLISSFLKPHDPFMPAARFASMFRAEDMHLPDTWGKLDLSTAPVEVRNAIQNNVPTPELSNPEEARKRIAFYYASLAQMDDCVGQVLAALRELGLDNNTIVLYTSDHGEMLGERGMWQKFEFYEGSCGVPLLMRVPGVTSGVCPAPLSQVSLLPTLAQLCNVPVTQRLDGFSFAEQLKNPSTPARHPVFSEYNLRTPRAKYMLREGRYKYTFWTHDIAELYDLETDPKEMRNLAQNARFAPTVDAMKNKLLAWYQPPEIR